MKSQTFDFLTENEVNSNLKNKLIKDTKEYFFKYLYNELITELKKADLINDVKTNTIFNSSSALVKSYKNNKIYYFNGYLKGDFNVNSAVEVKQLGGVWDKNQFGYKVQLFKLPMELQTLIINSTYAKKNIETKLLSNAFVAGVITKITQAFLKNDYSVYLKNTLQEAKNKIEKQTTIKPTIIENEMFTKFYTEQLNISIKGFVKEDVNKLRKNILKIISQGGSHLDVRKALNHNYHLNKNRAVMIADGETRLLLTTYQQEVFKSKGLNKFYWIHANPSGEESRPMHVHYYQESLKGKIFDYNNLPIDPETGKEDAPGIQYNCRCKARIIVDK